MTLAAGTIGSSDLRQFPVNHLSQINQASRAIGSGTALIVQVQMVACRHAIVRAYFIPSEWLASLWRFFISTLGNATSCFRTLTVQTHRSMAMVDLQPRQVLRNQFLVESPMAW